MKTPGLIHRCRFLMLLIAASLLFFYSISNAQGLKGDKDRKESTSRSNSSSSTKGNSGYTTAIGLRGGYYTTGITFKHFVAPRGALEFILGARYHGVFLAGLYEGHSGYALDVPGLSWVYGGGLRIGYYSGRYYYGYLPCESPWNPKCEDYWYDRYVAPVGIVGIGGLEYQFEDVPLTVSLDLMPYFYLYHSRGLFMDVSLSIRYIIK